MALALCKDAAVLAINVVMLMILGRRMAAPHSGYSYALLQEDRFHRWGPDDIEAFRAEGQVEQCFFKHENRDYLLDPSLGYNLTELLSPKPFQSCHNFPNTVRLRQLAEDAEVSLPIRVMSALGLTLFLQMYLLLAILLVATPIWLDRNRAMDIARNFVMTQFENLVSQYYENPTLSSQLVHEDQKFIPGMADMIQALARSATITSLLVGGIVIWFLYCARQAFRTTMIELIFSAPQSYRFKPSYNWSRDLRFVGTFCTSFVFGSSLFQAVFFLIIHVLSTEWFWNALWEWRIPILAYLIYFLSDMVLKCLHRKMVANAKGVLINSRLHAFIMFSYELMNFPKATLCALINVCLVVVCAVLMLMRPDVNLIPRGLEVLDYVHYIGPSLQNEALQSASRHNRYLKSKNGGKATG